MMNPKQKRAKKDRLIKIYGSLCWWCERSFPEKELTLEHLLPKSKGGSDSDENLRLAGKNCNQARGNSLYPPKKCIFHG
jgi:5-methylcytosine-specific restriction endonuclease McrA